MKSKKEKKKKSKSKTKFIIIVSVFLLLIAITVLLNIKVNSKSIKNIKEHISIQDTTILDKETEWDVTWYSITGDYKFGGSVGKSKFPSNFLYDWGLSEVYKDYYNYIGFIATAYIKAPRNGLYHFKIGSDDGAKLIIDGTTILTNQWNYGGSYSTSSTKYNLKKGMHHITLKYYEKYKEASVLFDCSPELLSWKEILVNKRDTFIMKQETTIVTKKIIDIILGK